MVQLPDVVVSVINNPKTHKTIATRFQDGRIHTIFMGSLMAISSARLAFARILTKRTHRNLQEAKTRGDLVSVSVTLDMTSYEIMSKPIEYDTSGDLCKQVKDVLAKMGVLEEMEKLGMSYQGAWSLEPLEVWNQSASVQAGTRML